MSEVRVGNLFYDAEMGRYDICFGINAYYGGLQKYLEHGLRSGLKWMMNGIWSVFRM